MTACARSGQSNSLRLGGAVRFERAVIVEMIVREIREQRGMEPHARNAMLIERVRGDFDTEMRHIVVAQLGELPMHSDAIRGRMRAGLMASTGPWPSVPAYADFPSLRMRPRDVSRGRFAVRTGDSDDRHRSRRRIEESIGDSDRAASQSGIATRRMCGGSFAAVAVPLAPTTRSTRHSRWLAAQIPPREYAFPAMR